MKILLFGKDGQVGRELQRTLQALGPLVSLGRDEADFEKGEALRASVREHRPSVIVNAAAYTAVDRAEDDFEKANMINGTAVGILAEEARRSGALFVHYSTDYVFDGRKPSPYVETDDTNPLNKYGESKLAGENLAREAGCELLIFRSAWIYSQNGANFPLAILRKAAEGGKIKVVADSVGAPTSARLVAEVSAAAIRRAAGESRGRLSGIYHLVAAGEASWYDYARFLLDEARRRGLPVKFGAEGVHPTSSAEYNPHVRRPQNSRLNTQKLRDTFGTALPDWRSDVAKFVEETAVNRQ